MLAYVASKDAVRISEQQRTDSHSAFIKRVSIQPEDRLLSQLVEGGQIVITNWNSMPTEMYLHTEVEAGPLTGDFNFQIQIDACTQLTIRTQPMMGADTSQGWDGSHSAYVYNPLDGGWWQYDVVPAHRVSREVAVPRRYQMLPPAFESAGKVKELPVCV
ncbi:hypothetical protein GCM10022248_94030 [Nonomuraea soli]